MVLFSGVIFDGICTLVIQWAQASRVRFLRLDWRRRLAYVVSRNARGLFTANLILSGTLLLVLVARFGLLVRTALGLLCWNVVQLAVVIILGPPVIVIYYACVLVWTKATYDSCYLTIKSSFKSWQFRRFARKVNELHVDNLNQLEDALEGIHHANGEDGMVSADVSGDHKQPREENKHDKFDSKSKNGNRGYTMEDHRSKQREIE